MIYEILLKIIIAIFIVRFYVNQYRLGGNFIVENINKYTQPITFPFNQLLKSVRMRYDYTALIAAFIIAFIGAFIQFKSIGGGLVIGLLYYFLQTWISVLIYALFVVVIGSWLFPDPQKPVMQVANSCTQWMMKPIQRVIPSFGGLDFSPIIVFFLLNIINGFISMQLQSFF